MRDGGRYHPDELPALQAEARRKHERMPRLSDTWRPEDGVDKRFAAYGRDNKLKAERNEVITRRYFCEWGKVGKRYTVGMLAEQFNLSTTRVRQIIRRQCRRVPGYYE